MNTTLAALKAGFSGTRGQPSLGRWWFTATGDRLSSSATQGSWCSRRLGAPRGGGRARRATDNGPRIDARRVGRGVSWGDSSQRATGSEHFGGAQCVTQAAEDRPAGGPKPEHVDQPCLYPRRLSPSHERRKRRPVGPQPEHGDGACFENGRC